MIVFQYVLLISMMVTRVAPLEFHTIIIISQNPIHYLIPNMAIITLPVPFAHITSMVCSIPPSMCSLLCLSPLPRTLLKHLTTPYTLDPECPIFNLRIPNPQSSILNPLRVRVCLPYILDAQTASLPVILYCPMRAHRVLPVPL